MGLEFKSSQLTTHVLQRCREHGITVDDVIRVAATGEAIREYPDEKPYPCYLLLGRVSERPLHVVAALDAESQCCILITAYWPDPEVWDADFRTKKGTS